MRPPPVLPCAAGSDSDVPAGVADDPFFQREDNPFDDPFFQVRGPPASSWRMAKSWRLRS